MAQNIFIEKGIKYKTLQYQVNYTNVHKGGETVIELMFFKKNIFKFCDVYSIINRKLTDTRPA